jgi:preprotein translocase subunit SecG
MLDKLTTVLVTIFIVTAVGIALRPKAPTASVLKAFFGGIAETQKAAFGPS